MRLMALACMAGSIVDFSSTMERSRDHGSLPEGGGGVIMYQLSVVEKRIYSRTFPLIRGYTISTIVMNSIVSYLL